MVNLVEIFQSRVVGATCFRIKYNRNKMFLHRTFVDHHFSSPVLIAS
jgi:hypothetical protein